MPPTFSTVSGAVSAAPLDLITSALTRAGILAAGEQPSPEDAALGLEELQLLIDQFNARSSLIYNVNFPVFTLQANHSPHTIGPTGDFDVPVRPVKIVSWSYIFTGTPSVEIPRAVRDQQWWANNRIKDLPSTLPTDLYYSPDIPLGNCYFWPVPTNAARVRLETWVGLAQAVDYVTAIAMPPAYWKAIVLSLAINLCPSFEKEASRTLVALQQEAMKAIIANNGGAPRIQTDGAGLGGRSYRPDYSFLTGEPW